MTPPLSKDWWAVAALASAAGTAPLALAQVTPIPPAPPPLSNTPNTGRQQVGIVTTVAPQLPSGVQIAPLFVDSAANQRVVNATPGPMHILFSDQSAVTLAPTAEIIIAQYRYQPEQRQGSLAINLIRGGLRVIGGLISKTNTAQVRTSTATIGIRGGISVVEVKDNGRTEATFLFGEDLTFTLDSGRRSVGGSSDSPVDVDALRTAGWFTADGLGGDSGQSDAPGGGLAAVTMVLTQPGWQAQGGGDLLARIATAKLSAEQMSAVLGVLNQAAALVAGLSGGPGAQQANAVVRNAINQVAATLPPVPAPPFALPPIAIPPPPSLGLINPVISGQNPTTAPSPPPPAPAMPPPAPPPPRYAN